MSTEVREKLKIIPPQVKVIQHIRHSWTHSQQADSIYFTYLYTKRIEGFLCFH
nr:IS66 family transposase zinc-finger binding domain-containing protein [Sporolactobacillus spathodeae]